MHSLLFVIPVDLIYHVTLFETNDPLEATKQRRKCQIALIIAQKNYTCSMFDDSISCILCSPLVFLFALMLLLRGKNHYYRYIHVVRPPEELVQKIYIYSTTKETHQSLLGAIMEIIIKNENIFIPYSVAINSVSFHRIMTQFCSNMFMLFVSV